MGQKLSILRQRLKSRSPKPPILKAIENGDVDAVCELLRKGLDVNGIINFTDTENVTALHWAVLYEHVDIVKILLCAGSDVNSVCHRHYDDGNSDHNVTPLMIAVKAKNTDLIQCLLDAGCDKEVVTTIKGDEKTFECTALGIAIINEPNLEVLTQLYKAGCSEEASITIKEKECKMIYTPLHYVIYTNECEIVKFLLYSGCNKEAIAELQSSDGTRLYGPLYLAVLFINEDRQDIVKVLLEAGCNMKAYSKGGSMKETPTPLHLAVAKKMKTSIKMLMEIPELNPDEASDYILKKDHNHMTALMLAQLSGQVEIAAYLKQFIKEKAAVQGLIAHEQINFQHKLGKYQLDAFHSFARGAYGDVYHASIGSNGPLVVMKKISWEVESSVLDFDPMREVDIAKQLTDHKNIAKVLDSITQPRSIWIVMEFCELGDLEAYCKKTIPALDERVDILTQTTCGLMYLHSQQPPVIHRDLKLRNILLKKEGGQVVAKLSDFGCAKQILDTVMGTLCGTQTFWAPECLPQAGKVVYRKEVDILALGLIYLVMIQFREDYLEFEPQIDGETDGRYTIAWTMQQAKEKDQKIPDVVKEYPWDHELICRIKKLISAMTRYQAKDRISLTEVYWDLQQMNKVLQF